MTDGSKTFDSDFFNLGADLFTLNNKSSALIVIKAMSIVKKVVIGRKYLRLQRKSTPFLIKIE